MKRTTLFLVASAIMISTNLFAQRSNDVEGSKDYSLVSRFQGSVIEWYDVKSFDRYFMLSLKENTLDKYEIDGKITRIQYSSQPQHSVFEIFKSYENALKNAGFEILLTLDKTNCGINLSEQLYIGEFNGLNSLPAGKAIKPDFKEGEFAYLSAKKKINDKDVYIVVYITNWDWPLITFDAIEVQSMDKGLVTVKDLETDLSQNGHIAIYGIHFDTGKSDIKPESAQTLRNIAEFMTTHPDKKYIIVGHTDNTGDFDNNLKLSLERANAVINELVTKYNVKAAQVRAYGNGSTAPISTNATDEGRAKNRRVEIVEQ